MAKVIYKKGCEGQNKLSSIEGIEIDLLNGQKALIYPRYAERQILPSEQIGKWDAAIETGIEALKVEDTSSKTKALLMVGSPLSRYISFGLKSMVNSTYLPCLLRLKSRTRRRR